MRRYKSFNSLSADCAVFQVIPWNWKKNKRKTNKQAKNKQTKYPPQKKTQKNVSEDGCLGGFYNIAAGVLYC